MNRIRPVGSTDIDQVAEWLDVSLAAGETAAAEERLNILFELYETLEESARPREHGDTSPGAVFTASPEHLETSDDPHNAWLERFSLENPDAEGLLSNHTVAIKDNTCVRGVEMTCGSRAFEGFVPRDNAVVVDRILAAGGEIVGKTNMDELAFGPTSETSAFGATLNPRNKDHVAGGSSSGSAAAVAAGEADLALGTDTGGSVRIPASYCGIVGVKPTYGAVPLDGIVELAYSMDHPGPLARDVRTAARGFDVFADDEATEHSPVSDTLTDRDPDTLTIGVSEQFYRKHVSLEVEEAVRAAIGDLEEAGAEITPVTIPSLAESRPCWWGIAPVEFAAAYLSNGIGLWRHGAAAESLTAALTRVRRSDSRHLGSNVKEMLLLGGHLLTTHNGYHYARARSLRSQLRQEFDSALADVDVLACPGTPTTAPEVGGFERGVTPPVNWNTHPTNLTGHPSIVLPCGSDDAGLPIGLQLIAPWDDERTMFQAAYAYEQKL